ncbi:MAG: ParB/RepB/Spo0J family partition protein [Candidatus Krumholzibacteria bacterium]|nr:ParB/RepB/Spo0J family partition protein [Candidatus Krumholzibacteria bacterium]
MRKKVLGRGLEALISQDLKDSIAETERVREIALGEIDPNPHQPRDHFDDKHLGELAESIKRNGVLQPVVVRRAGDRYQLIVGERRLRASEIAEKTTIPAIVRNVDDNDALKLALLENLQREDLNPIEEARGYLALKQRTGLSSKEIASILGKNRSTVANTLRLLNLPTEVIGLIEAGRLRAGHARAILSVDGEKEQIAWARKVVEDGFTVRDIELAVKPEKKKRRRKSTKGRDPVLAEFEERLEAVLGTRVRILPRKKGGLITIEFFSDNDLESVLERIGIDLTL